MSNEKVNITKLKSELEFYRGFYEGVKEMTTLLGDGPIDINHNFNISKENPKMKVTVGSIDGEAAEAFKKMLKEMGVE
jgi:hypothetical protein